MKRVLISVLVVMLLMTGVAYTSQFNVVKQAGDVKVTVVVENDPLKVGDNNLRIELLDSKENAVTDADVSVYYFMPSMPAMNYEAKSTLKGNTYATVIKPVMPGEWTADISVKKTGEVIKKVSVNFNVK